MFVEFGLPWSSHVAIATRNTTAAKVRPDEDGL